MAQTHLVTLANAWRAVLSDQVDEPNPTHGFGSSSELAI